MAAVLGPIAQTVASQARSRGRKFDPIPVPYLSWDWAGTNIFGHSPPSTDSIRAIVSYKRKYVHEVLVNCSVKLAQEKCG